jgi:hypothetical protein
MPRAKAASRSAADALRSILAGLARSNDAAVREWAEPMHRANRREAVKKRPRKKKAASC